MEPISFISAQDFKNLLNQNKKPDILDIRTDIEYRTVALDCPVRHIPLHDIDAKKLNAERDSKKPLYVLCKAGPRAQKACEFLASNGHHTLVVIEGGILGCSDCDAPLKYGDKPATQPEIMTAIQESVQKFMMKHS